MDCVTSTLHHLNIGIPVSFSIPNALNKKVPNLLKRASIRVYQLPFLLNGIHIGLIVIVVNA